MQGLAQKEWEAGLAGQSLNWLDKMERNKNWTERSLAGQSTVVHATQPWAEQGVIVLC